MTSWYDLSNAQRRRVQRLKNGKIIKTKFGFCRKVIGNKFVYTSYTDHTLDLQFQDSEESAENCYRAMIDEENKQRIKFDEIDSLIIRSFFNKEGAKWKLNT